MNAIEYAINMEIDGENFYMEQASLNKNNSVGVVCLKLAEAERAHARHLTDIRQKRDMPLPEKASYLDMSNIFSNAVDFKSEISESPKQLEFYRMSLELEQKSIDLYAGLFAETEDQSEKELFQYLADEERRHFALLDELVTRLRHAEEWVESEEFGLRKESY